MPSLRSLAQWGLLGLSCSVIQSARAAVYTYSNPDTRDSPCTNRCASIEEPGVWRCDDVTDSTGAATQVCNTFALDSGNCHFHYYTREEVGQCMHTNQMDFIFIGASHQNGIFSTVFPWFDTTIQGQETVDVAQWANLDTTHLQDPPAHAWDYGCVQLSISATGAINWKGGDAEFLASPQIPACQSVLARAPGPDSGDFFMTYNQARSFYKANEMLDALKTAGRQDRKAIVMSGIGAWFTNCWDQGPVAPGAFDYCAASTYPEGPTVKAFKDAGDETGFLAWYLDQIVAFGNRLKTEFPNYTYVTYNGAYKDTQRYIIEKAGKSFGGFVNIYDMQFTDNSAPMVDYHDVNSVNMMVWQRLLSYGCANQHPVMVECGEEFIGNSQCQWNAQLESLENPWSDQWNRPCDITSYASADQFDTTGIDDPVPGSTTGSGTGGIADSQVVLDTNPIASYASAAATSTGSTAEYEAWDYTISQIIMVLIAIVFVAYIFKTSSDTGERATLKEKKLKAKQAAVAQSAVAASGTAAAVAAKAAADEWGSIKALSGARYLASLHVVAGHYQNLSPQVIENWYVIGWGFTWVPWFMMVSGFILTYTSFKRQAVTGKAGVLRPAYEFVTARVMSIYPLYFLSLMCAYIYAFSNNTWKNISWLEVFCSLTLTQAWNVAVTEQVVQAQCWFLSAIVPLWFAHGYMERWISGLSIGKVWAVVFIIFFFGWLPAIIPKLAGVSMDWYTVHEWGSTATWTDMLVVMLKFNPIFYVHIYGFGICLAALFRHYRASPPFIFRYGAILGYIGLIVIFTQESLQPPAYKLTCRLGLLAPLHGLMMLGLAYGKDPLCRILGSWPMLVLGTYSYAQYCFQYIAIDAWQGWADLGEILFLMAMSMCAAAVSVIIFGDKDTKRFKMAMRCIGAWSLLGLFIWCLIPSAVINDWKGSSSYESSAAVSDTDGLYVKGSTLPYVQYGGGSFDARLNMTADQAMLGGSSEYDIINPSIMEVGGKLFVAARRHRMDYDTTPKKRIEGYPVITTEWFSDIAYGELDSVTLAPKAALQVLAFTPGDGDAIGSAWTPCAQEPVFNSANGTYSQHIVSGPQDPRLFVEADGKLVMTFFSTVPVATAGGYCAAEGTIGNMYITQGDLQLAATTSNAIVAKTVTSPSAALAAADQQLYEKNWMAMMVNTDIAWFQNLSPLTIFTTTVAAPGTVANETLAGGETPLDSIAQSMQVDVHGGSNFIYVNSIFEDPFYMAAFHTLSADGTYINYLVKVGTAQPYTLQAISRPLPVVSAAPECPVFASGLTMHGDGFLVSYGSCDEQSRVVSFDYNDLTTFFKHPESDQWDGNDPSEYGVVGVGIGVEQQLAIDDSIKSGTDADEGLGAFLSVFLCALLVEAVFFYLLHLNEERHVAQKKAAAERAVSAPNTPPVVASGVLSDDEPKDIMVVEREGVVAPLHMMDPESSARLVGGNDGQKEEA